MELELLVSKRSVWQNKNELCLHRFQSILVAEKLSFPGQNVHY